jgi:hypothetical protein
VVAELDQELAEAEVAARNLDPPLSTLPPLGALSAQATSLLLEQARAMWLRVTTFLVVAAKRPVASSTPLFDQPIPWSLLGWSITTCDAAVQAQRSSTQNDFLPVPDT